MMASMEEPKQEEEEVESEPTTTEMEPGEQEEQLPQKVTDEESPVSEAKEEEEAVDVSGTKTNTDSEDDEISLKEEISTNSDDEQKYHREHGGESVGGSQKPGVESDSQLVAPVASQDNLNNSDIHSKVKEQQNKLSRTVHLPTYVTKQLILVKKVLQKPNLVVPMLLAPELAKASELPTASEQTKAPDVPSASSLEESCGGKRKREKSISNGTVEVVDLAPSVLQEPLNKRRKNLKTDGSLQEVDRYCWTCHRDGIVVSCATCPRVYHLRCVQLEGAPSEEWVCPECITILNAENVETRSRAMRQLSLDQLCNLLKYALHRMKAYPGTEPFCKPVDQNMFPRYREFVAHPMDLSQLERNIRRRMYGSTEAFIADTKWILHDCIIFNTHHTKLSSTAKAILKICKQEMSEIEICPDCYLNAHTRKDSWFIEVCRKPHVLLWAKLKGFPFWPAKVMRTNRESMVDVRFFGAHDRAWVPVRDCFLYSKCIPTIARNKKKHNLEACVNEVEQHIKKLRERFGRFSYAPFRTPFDPTLEEEHLTTFLPGYSGEKMVSQLPFPHRFRPRILRKPPTSESQSRLGCPRLSSVNPEESTPSFSAGVQSEGASADEGDDEGGISGEGADTEADPGGEGADSGEGSEACESEPSGSSPPSSGPPRLLRVYSRRKQSPSSARTSLSSPAPLIMMTEEPDVEMPVVVKSEVEEVEPPKIGSASLSDWARFEMEAARITMIHRHSSGSEGDADEMSAIEMLDVEEIKSEPVDPISPDNPASPSSQPSPSPSSPKSESPAPHDSRSSTPIAAVADDSQEEAAGEVPLASLAPATDDVFHPPESKHDRDTPTEKADRPTPSGESDMESVNITEDDTSSLSSASESGEQEIWARMTEVEEEDTKNETTDPSEEPSKTISPAKESKILSSEKDTVPSNTVSRKRTLDTSKPEDSSVSVTASKTRKTSTPEASGVQSPGESFRPRTTGSVSKSEEVKEKKSGMLPDLIRRLHGVQPRMLKTPSGRRLKVGTETSDSEDKDEGNPLQEGEESDNAVTAADYGDVNSPVSGDSNSNSSLSSSSSSNSASSSSSSSSSNSSSTSSNSNKSSNGSSVSTSHPSLSQSDDQKPTDFPSSQLDSADSKELLRSDETSAEEREQAEANSIEPSKGSADKSKEGEDETKSSSMKVAAKAENVTENKVNLDDAVNGVSSAKRTKKEEVNAEIRNVQTPKETVMEESDTCGKTNHNVEISEGNPREPGNTDINKALEKEKKEEELKSSGEEDTGESQKNVCVEERKESGRSSKEDNEKEEKKETDLKDIDNEVKVKLDSLVKEKTEDNLEHDFKEINKEEITKSSRNFKETTKIENVSELKTDKKTVKIEKSDVDKDNKRVQENENQKNVDNSPKVNKIKSQEAIMKIEKDEQEKNKSNKIDYQNIESDKESLKTDKQESQMDDNKTKEIGNQDEVKKNQKNATEARDCEDKKESQNVAVKTSELEPKEEVKVKQETLGEVLKEHGKEPNRDNQNEAEKDKQKENDQVQDSTAENNKECQSVVLKENQSMTPKTSQKETEKINQKENEKECENETRKEKDILPEKENENVTKAESQENTGKVNKIDKGMKNEINKKQETSLVERAEPQKTEESGNDKKDENKEDQSKIVGDENVTKEKDKISVITEESEERKSQVGDEKEECEKEKDEKDDSEDMKGSRKTEKQSDEPQKALTNEGEKLSTESEVRKDEDHKAKEKDRKREKESQEEPGKKASRTSSKKSAPRRLLLAPRLKKPSPEPEPFSMCEADFLSSIKQEPMDVEEEESVPEDEEHLLRPTVNLGLGAVKKRKGVGNEANDDDRDYTASPASLTDKDNVLPSYLYPSVTITVDNDKRVETSGPSVHPGTSEPPRSAGTQGDGTINIEEVKASVGLPSAISLSVIAASGGGPGGGGGSKEASAGGAAGAAADEAPSTASSGGGEGGECRAVSVPTIVTTPSGLTVTAHNGLQISTQPAPPQATPNIPTQGEITAVVPPIRGRARKSFPNRPHPQVKITQSLTNGPGKGPGGRRVSGDSRRGSYGSLSGDVTVSTTLSNNPVAGSTTALNGDVSMVYIPAGAARGAGLPNGPTAVANGEHSVAVRMGGPSGVGHMQGVGQGGGRLLPQLQPRPLGTKCNGSVPAEAGPISAEICNHAQKLAGYMQQALEEMLRDMCTAGNVEASTKMLQLELEKVHWRYQQEIAELKHNTDLLLVEMRASMMSEQQRAVAEAVRQCEIEKQRAIEETKKKQWCTNCGKEALFYCCWNTSYCDYPCQQRHWPQHMASCGQAESMKARETADNGLPQTAGPTAALVHHAPSPKSYGAGTQVSADAPSSRPRCMAVEHPPLSFCAVSGLMYVSFVHTLYLPTACSHRFLWCAYFIF